MTVEPLTSEEIANLRRMVKASRKIDMPSTMAERFLATIDAREVATVAIVSTPDTMSGQARFDGTRVPLRIPLAMLAAGEPVETISRMYPTLPEGWYQVALALKGLLRRKYRDAIR